MGESKIEWTEKTWNPLRGCSRVSAGCVNCYAERFAARFSEPGKTFHGFVRRTPNGPRWTGVVSVVEDHLRDPLKWKKPARIFVNSMSDLFHESVSGEDLDRIFAVMACAPQHTFQVLTKRPHRMRDYLQSRSKSASFWKSAALTLGRSLEFEGLSLVRFPLPNVWLGVSVENQETADLRIPVLLGTPAAVRFVSAEPLLGPVNLAELKPDGDLPEDGWSDTLVREIDSLRGWQYELENMRKRSKRKALDWVIVGGESGPRARPFRIEWAREIVRQCSAAGTAVFVKQLGARPLWNGCGLVADNPPCRTVPVVHEGGEALALLLSNAKGGDPQEWPADLRRREFPSPKSS